MPDRIPEYRRAVRAAVRGVWTGALNQPQGVAALGDGVKRYFRLAFYEGAKECGILPDEMTTPEKTKLSNRIQYEFTFMKGFIVVVREGRKGSENAKPLAQFFRRAEMWVNRYTELRDLGKMLACGDRKMMWVWHPEKEHCDSCRRLNGKVKRASQWEAARAQGIYPQSPALKCGGYKCGCELKPTDEPMSKGRLPSIS